MIAVVTSVVLPLLFAGAGTLGLSVLVSSWRQHGGAYARLRAELAALEDGDRTASVDQIRLPALPAAGPRRTARPLRVTAAARPASGGLRAAA